MRKSHATGYFYPAESLEKGGPGSGKKGHKTPKKFEPRMPYPGEEAHKNPEPKQKYKQPSEQELDEHKKKMEMEPHYSDSPALANYKKLMNHPKLGAIVEGRIEYDKKKDQIIVTDPSLKDFIEAAKKQSGGK